MYHTVQEFLEDWRFEVEKTRTILAALTDEALNQKVWAEGRTLQTLAWHIVRSISEMMGRVGFVLEGPLETSPETASAGGIRAGYADLTASLDRQLQEHWTDEDLQREHDMYGKMWSNAKTLKVLVVHEIHHRGQLTVLMRQAGLKVPGIYGPAREEWSSCGLPPHP
ncbi:MAG: DinB family protein [Bacteroidota bacterium]|jgi:uncharacterized damage-inducible protein DinB